jgi:hypothetical protein
MDLVTVRADRSSHRFAERLLDHQQTSLTHRSG